MKKSLLATMVLSLTLIGCGGGGGGGDNSSSGGETKPTPQTPTLADAIDLNSANGQSWFEFNDNDEDLENLFTHTNYNDPYQYTFKGNKILSKRNMPTDQVVYPTYITSSKAYIYDVNDTVDNVDSGLEHTHQRIGTIKKSDVITENDSNGVKQTYWVVQFVPYGENINDTGALVITHKYRLIDLNGKSIAESLNPALYATINNPATKSLYSTESYMNKFYTAYQLGNPSKLAETKFTNGAVCLALDSTSANQGYFFAKHGGYITPVEADNIRKDYQFDLKQSYVLKSEIPISIESYSPAEQVNPEFFYDYNAALVHYNTNDKSLMTAQHYFGTFDTGAKNTAQDRMTRKYNRYVQDLKDYEQWVDKELAAQMLHAYDLEKENYHKGCDLYNQAGRDQARLYLTKVNNVQ